MNPRRFTMIIILLLMAGIAVGAWLWVPKVRRTTSNSSVSTNAQSTGAPAQVAAPAVDFDQICHCDLILTDGSSINLYATATKTTSTVIAAGGEGEGGTPSAGFLALSPSGRHVLLFDATQRVLTLKQLPDNTVLRTYTTPTNATPTAFAWSPDEAAVAMMLDAQTIFLWSSTVKQSLPVPSDVPTAQHDSSLAVDPSATMVLYGWSTGDRYRIDYLTTTAKPVSITFPTDQIQSSSNSLHALNGLYHGYGLAYLGDALYQVNTATGKATRIADRVWSDFPMSAASPDGENVMFLKRSSDTAHGQLFRFNSSLATTIDHQVSFDFGSGLQQTLWIPGTGFLLVYNSYDQRWYVIDTIVGAQHPLRPVTMPVGITAQQVSGVVVWTPMSADEVSLYEFGAQPLTSDAQQQLINQLSNPASFTPLPGKVLSSTPCGQNPTADQQLAALDASDKRSTTLNGALTVVTTPNLYHWTSAQFQTFLQQAYCGVGGYFARTITDSTIYWWQPCLGGIGPEPGSAEERTAVACIQAQIVVDQHFGISE